MDLPLGDVNDMVVFDMNSEYVGFRRRIHR